MWLVATYWRTDTEHSHHYRKRQSWAGLSVSEKGWDSTLLRAPLAQTSSRATCFGMLKASFSFLSFETNPPFLPGTSLPFGGLKTTWWFGNWATEGSEEIFTPAELPIRASHGPRASVDHASGHTLPVWDLQVPLRAGCLEFQTFSHRVMIINGSLISGPASQNSILRTIYLSKYSDSLLSLRHVVSLSCSHRLGSSGWHRITEEPVQGLRGHLGSWFHFPDSE